jgi:glutathione S-transferase
MNIDPWNIFTSNFGQMPKPYTAFATLIDMALYLFVTIKVGHARTKHKVQAPSVDGPPIFQRVFRVQQNTLEQLALHLPLLWIAAYAMDDVFAAAFGSVWIFGRILYAIRYYDKAQRRTKGFIISMTANAILFIGCLASVIASF